MKFCYNSLNLIDQCASHLVLVVFAKGRRERRSEARALSPLTHTARLNSATGDHDLSLQRLPTAHPNERLGHLIFRHPCPARLRAITGRA